MGGIGRNVAPQLRAYLKKLAEHAEEKPGVVVDGVSDAGLDSDVTLAFRASRHTPYVTVQVQSASQGGEAYNPSTFVSRTRYDTHATKRRVVTISRTDDEKYYAYLVPEVEIPPGCGSFVSFNGEGDTEDLKAFVDLGKRTVDASEFADGFLRSLVSEDIEESDFDTDGVTEGRLTLEVLATDTYDIQFYTRQGRSVTWTTGTLHEDQTQGATVSETVDLVEGTLSFIAYEVLLANTSTVLGRSVVAFDPAAVAEIRHFALSLDEGTLSAEVAGDSDTAKIYLTRTTDGTEPADPTAANADQTVAARSGTVTFSGTVPVGSVARVKARGENASTTLSDLVREMKIERTSVGTDEVEDGAVSEPKLSSAVQTKLNASGAADGSDRFGTDIVFTASDQDTVLWSSGTVYVASGSSHAINAGSATISGLTYLYLDTAVSTSELQTTTDISVAAGAASRYILATAKPAAVSGQNAFVVPVVGELFLNQNQISPDAISTDRIQANAVTATKISVNSLSAIAADVGVLTAGILRDSASKFFADLDAALLTVSDDQATPEDRVKLGKLGAGGEDYGIEVYDAAGGLILGAGGLGLDVVDTDQIADGSVGETQIGTGAVVTSKLAAGAVQADKLAAGSVVAEKLSVGTGSPFLGQQVNDWTSSSHGSVPAHSALALVMDSASDWISFGFLRAADDDGTTRSYDIEVEVYGASILQTTNDDQVGAFGSQVGDTITVSGQIVSASGAMSTGDDVYSIQVDDLSSVILRVRLVSTTEDSFGVSLGDRIARLDPGAPFEFFCSPVDASDYDVTRLLNSGALAALDEVDTVQIANGAVIASKIAVGSLQAVSAEIGGTLFLPSNERIRYGTQASPTTITKTLRLPAQSFSPEEDTTTWRIGAAFLQPGSTGSDQVFYAPVTLPPGITITEVRLRSLRQSSSDTVQLDIFDLGSSPGLVFPTATITNTSTSGSYRTDSATGLTIENTGRTVTLKLTLHAAANTADAAVTFVDIDYEVANLSQAI